jgi:negative regulator of PHO system
MPLFRGKDNNDQLLHIMKILGTPSHQQFAKMLKDSVSPSPSFLTLLALNRSQPEIVLKDFPPLPKMNLAQVLPKASPAGNRNPLRDLDGHRLTKYVQH